MKKRLFLKGLFLFGLFFTLSIASKAQCTYTLSLDDTFGDGWNGNSLDVTVGATTTNYTGPATFNTIINLSVNTGDSIILNYLAGGAFNTEVSFTLTDPSGIIVYASGLNPFTGVHSRSVAACPSCLAPNNLMVSNLSDTSAQLNWSPQGTAIQWEVEYGIAGFTLGTGTSTIVNTNTFLAIMGLMPQTTYDWYVRSICAPMDTSAFFSSSFTTNCSSFSAPFIEEFNTFTPLCWEQADDGTPATGPINIGTSDWFLNNSSFRMNIWNLGKSDWVISPDIDFGTGGYEIVFDVAAYDFGGNLGGAFGGMDADDTVQVLSSKDGGITWKAEYTWDINNPPTSSTFTPITIDVASFTGTNNLIAIYGSEGATSGTQDYWFEIDRFEVRIPPLCPAPFTNAAINVSADSAVVSWVENGTSAEWEVEWDTAGYTPGTGSNSMVVLIDTFLNITGLSSSTAYDWNVRAICGRSDSSAWSTGSFITTFNPPAGINCTTGNPSVIFTEEFDNNNAGWTGSLGPAGGQWEIPDGSGSFNTGAATAQSGSSFMNFEASGSPATGGAVVSPAIDLTTAQGDVELSFWLHAFGANMGDLSVGVGTSAAGPFTQLFFSSGQIQTADTDPWQNVGINLASFIGQTIYLEFNMTNINGYTSDMSIDLVEVSTCASCAIPSSQTASNLTLTDADLVWVENGTATTWEIEWGPAGFTPGSGTSVVTTTNPYSLSGLTASTAYSWYVRAICAPGDTSGFAGASSFNTLNGIPYAEDFDGFPVGNVASSGWANSRAATVPDWTIGSATGSLGTGPLNDHTTGSGQFVYLETSGTTLGLVDTLSSPGVLFGANDSVIQLEYWYHMNGAAMGDLQVWVESGGIWDSITTFVGQQQAAQADPWLRSQHLLTGYQGSAVTVYFLGISGSTYTSDMAVDDVSLGLPTVVPATPYYAIGTINTEDATGVADSSGVTCFTSGTVVGVDLDGNAGISFTIIDQSSGMQEGINIFNFNDVSNYVVTEGDSISVRGTISQFNGLTQLSPDSIALISSGHTIPTPIAVTALDESTESRWLTVNTNFVALGTSGTSGSFNFDLSNGTDTITVRIDGDTDIDDSLAVVGAIVAGDTVMLNGVGGQFDNASPFTDGYQIFPMRWSDVTIIRQATPPPPVVVPYYPIGTINTEDASGVADSSGVTCFTSGTVVGVDLDGNAGLSFYIIDQSSGSQEGINVFNFNDVNNYVVNEGDSIMVRGDIAQFNGLTEIIPDSISIISSGAAIPTPDVVTTLDETTEAIWLSIPTNYWLLNSISGTSSINADLTNGTDTITMRIDSDTDILDSIAMTALGNGQLNVNDTICGMFGIGGQFDGSNPFTDGYQIFPMRWSDLTICRIPVGINDVDAINTTFSIYPNPTTGQFVIETTGFNNASVNITVRDLEGRILRSEAINNANSTFSKSFDLSDNAKGVYFISIQDGENLINKKLIIQ